MSIEMYIKDIYKFPLLTPEEEFNLICLFKDNNNNDAYTKVIHSKLRLVVHIAKQYNNLGLSFLDLIEEGNLGLIKALSKFDQNKGYRFSTYASFWIKQYIIRAIENQGKTIQIPVYMNSMVLQWKKIKEQFPDMSGKRIARKMGISYEKLKLVARTARNVRSLNMLVGESGDELMNLIEDKKSTSPVEMIELSFKKTTIKKLLGSLSNKERQIIMLRFGLIDDNNHTLKYVAEKFNISRERVRQIEEEVLIKLKPQASKLKLQNSI